MLRIIAYCFFGISVLLVCLLYFFDEFVFRYLKRKHKAVWQKIGEPALFFNMNSVIARSVRGFEKNREYLLLNDEKLTKYILFKKGFLKVVWISMAITFILAFYVEAFHL